MKKLTVLIIIFATLFIGVSIWWKSVSGPVLPSSSATKSFLITKGTSASQIANNLRKFGLINSPLAFKIYTQATGNQRKILAGEFDLSPGFSLTEIISELTKGPKEVWVTVPEGLRREEVVENFIEEFGLSGESAVKFRAEFLALSKREEGRLFPDTYLFPKTAPAELVYNSLRTNFKARTKDLFSEEQVPDKVIILASFLERETVTNEERPVVAGILTNRLNAGWPLQVDATVQYAVADATCAPNCEDWWPKITREEYNFNSPYNTYKFPGLTPSPIASPGLSSIKAAADPSTTDYWYYLHDNEGNIRYAKTLEEHNRNVAKYIR